MQQRINVNRLFDGELRMKRPLRMAVWEVNIENELKENVNEGL
jgi:hypothetical protein